LRIGTDGHLAQDDNQVTVVLNAWAVYCSRSTRHDVKSGAIVTRQRVEASQAARVA
jgi:hypothetical protein